MSSHSVCPRELYSIRPGSTGQIDESCITNGKRDFALNVYSTAIIIITIVIIYLFIKSTQWWQKCNRTNDAHWAVISALNKMFNTLQLAKFEAHYNSKHNNTW